MMYAYTFRRRGAWKTPVEWGGEVLTIEAERATQAELHAQRITGEELCALRTYRDGEERPVTMQTGYFS